MPADFNALPRRQVAGSARQFCEAPLQKAPFRLLLRQGDRALVGGASLRGSAEASRKVGFGCVRQVVVVKLSASEDRVDKSKTGLGSVAHRHRHRAVELDYRRWFDAEQNIIEADDLSPVRGVGGWALRMDGGDRCLQRVRTETPR